jgi:hypothetical protein
MPNFHDRNAGGKDDGVWVQRELDVFLCGNEIRLRCIARLRADAAVWRVAQLLEYSFRPSPQEAKRLIVVGGPALDEDTKAIMARGISSRPTEKLKPSGWPVPQGLII